MKIGISQIQNKAPQWLRMLRNLQATLMAPTLTLLEQTGWVTDSRTLLNIALIWGYTIVFFIALCIISGVDPNKLQSEEEDKPKNEVDKPS